MSLVYILAAVFGIGLLIFIHELGHFLAARQIGARVEVFSLGFGPRLWGFQRGATDYRLCLIPVGGYVQVAGQDPGDNRYPREECLHSKSVGARLWFFSGGVLMNLLFALIVFPIVFAVGVEFPAPRIGAIVSGGPAWQAGLEVGDRIETLNGKPMYSFTNMEVEAALAGETVTLEVQRGDERFEVVAEPRYDKQRGLRVLGLYPSQTQEYHAVRVDPDGPAAAAGIKTGDRLVSVEGVLAFGDQVRQAWDAIPDSLGEGIEPEPISVVVERDGEEIEATWTPGVTEGSQPMIGVFQVVRRIVAVRDGTPSEWELAPGDVLVELDGAPFYGSYLTPLDQRLAERSGPVTAKVERNGSVVSLPAAAESHRASLSALLALGPESGQILVAPRPGSPALAAGIVLGTEVLAVDGEAIDDFEAFREKVHDAGTQAIALTVRSADAPQPRSIELVPSKRVADTGLTVEAREGLEVYQMDTFGGALSAGAVASLDLIKQLYVTLKKLITGDVAAKNLGGVITISRVSYRVAQWGPARFFYFLALLSLNLAFVNILPIPVLDGGHVLFLLIEKIKGSPVSPRVLGFSQNLGMIFVLALLLFVTYNDILRIIG